MRYLVRCAYCSHGDFRCAELLPDQRCPYCQSVPSSYVVDGVHHCWLHRVPFSGSYPVSDTHFFTVYAWRGSEWKFANAKLFEATGSERSAGTITFCPQCQDEYEQWLAAERTHDNIANAGDGEDSPRN